MASVTGAACAARAFVRPAGPPRPAPDADAAWAEATRTCRPVMAYAAAIALTGQIGERRIRGLAGATLDVALTKTGQIGLEARVSGQFAFRLGGTADRAVLVLEDRIVTAPAAAIVEALIGLAIDPVSLLAILSGCMSTSPSLERAERYGEIIEVVTADAAVDLERQAGTWRPRAGRVGDFAVEYRTFDRGVPRELWLRSADGRAPIVSLSLRVKNLDLNPALTEAAFNVGTPPSSTTMTIQELREAGPLGESSDSR